MYKLKSNTALIMIILLLTGCEQWLELIPPDGLVRDEYWKSKEDIKATLMGAYQKFAQLDEKLFLYGELRADLITEDNNTPSDHRLIMAGNIYPDNQLCDWTDFYMVINYCNNVLKYAPVVIEFDPTFSEYQMKGFEAEAIFLRSLAYFYLVRIFKDVPLVLEPSEEDNVNFFLPKSSDTTILRLITADLEIARLYVTDEYGSDKANIGRATKGAFLSLLADISLWNFEYEACIKYVEQVEELGYQIVPGGKWFEIFYPGNSLEGIFEFQFDHDRDQSNSLYDYTYWNKYYLASTNALELLSPSKEIIRQNGSLKPNDSKIWKYCGAAPDGKTLRPASQLKSSNWIVYRFADVLLMKAEALAMTGRYQEALQIVNEIRKKRLAAPVIVTFTPETLENVIMKERATELAFEGKRWFDLMRLGRRNNFKRKSKLIEIIIERVPSTQKLVLASKLTNPYGWYLPIEDDELERNNNLVQNPYYAVYSKE